MISPDHSGGSHACTDTESMLWCQEMGSTTIVSEWAAGMIINLATIEAMENRLVTAWLQGSCAEFQGIYVVGAWNILS